MKKSVFSKILCFASKLEALAQSEPNGIWVDRIALTHSLFSVSKGVLDSGVMRNVYLSQY